MTNTNEQFEHVVKICREVFEKKMNDYGPAWRILRPESVTDQIFIKATRIRSIETKGFSKIDEGIRNEFIGIVNYGVIALIQLDKKVVEKIDMDHEQAMDLYNEYIYKAMDLMKNKNHDYGEAWRGMRISSYTDLILMKLNRTKQIEDNKGETLISEGVDANYFDMINYAVFGLIKLELERSAS